MSEIWFEGPYGTLKFHAAGFHGSVYSAADGGGFKAEFNGRAIKKKFFTTCKAKKAMEKLARLKATQLLACLDAGISD